MNQMKYLLNLHKKKIITVNPLMDSVFSFFGMKDVTPDPLPEFDPLFTISSNNQTNKNQTDGTKTRRTKTTPERVHGYKPRRGRKPRSGKGEI